MPDIRHHQFISKTNQINVKLINCQMFSQCVFGQELLCYCANYYTMCRQIFIMINSSDTSAKIQTHDKLFNPESKKYLQVSLIENYKYYRYCKCKLSQPKKYFGTHGLLLVGMILYYSVCLKYNSTALIIITAILHALTTTVMISLAFIDPGIIPKILTHFQLQENKKIPLDPRYFVDYKREQRRSYAIKNKTHLLSLKFCQQCCIFRPPRTIHCYECNVCVQKFDHHCPWIGSCVAKNNYRYFLFFIITLAMLTWFCLGQIINAVVLSAKNNETVYMALNIILRKFSTMLVIYTFLAFAFSNVLVVYHIFLIKNSITTNQFCKNTWNQISGNPFQKQSCFKHFLKIFDSSIVLISDPEAHVKIRKKYQQNFQINQGQTTFVNLNDNIFNQSIQEKNKDNDDDKQKEKENKVNKSLSRISQRPQIQQISQKAKNKGSFIENNKGQQIVGVKVESQNKNENWTQNTVQTKKSTSEQVTPIAEIQKQQHSQKKLLGVNPTREDRQNRIDIEEITLQIQIIEFEN